jgi:hypothetical protein
MRLLGLGSEDVERYRAQVRAGNRADIPGAVRASLGINATISDVERLCAAVARLASGDPAPVQYDQDLQTGDFSPAGPRAPGLAAERWRGSSCSTG